MRFLRRCAVLLLLAGFATAVALATGSGEPEPGSAAGGLVELEMLTFGDKAPDADTVLNALNEQLESRLNTVLEVEYLTWANWESKYNLLLSSGERIDLSYSSNWSGFFRHASNGALLELEELIPEYAPQIWQAQPDGVWPQVTLEGHIYAVPNQWRQAEGWGMCYRDDLREAYDLPVPADLDTMEVYWEGIKDYAPEMFPVGNPEGEVFNLFWRALPDMYAPDGTELIYFEINDPMRIVSIFDMENEFLAFLRRVKRWADAGYWSVNSLSDQTRSMDGVKNGRFASAISSNKSKTADLAIELEASGSEWEVALLPMAELRGFEFVQAATSNLMVLPISCAHPARAIELLELLHNSEELQHLTIYGIEGKHYGLTESGRITYTGYDPDVVGFTIGSMWPNGWINGAYMFTPENEWSELPVIESRLQTLIKPNPYAAFFFDPTEVNSEVAAVDQARIEYLLPLLSGLVEDVDEGYRDAKDALMDAGFQRIVDEYRSQMIEYLERSGQI